MKRTKYQVLQQRVAQVERSQNRDDAQSLVETLLPKAKGGKRYRLLLNRALKVARTAPDRETVKRRELDNFKAAGQGIGLSRPPKFTGGNKVQGGLPGSKR